MRNRLLKTIYNPRLFPFGKKYCIRVSHLQFLIENFTKDQHQLTPTVLNPIDKQNFPSVLRICDDKVTDMLQKHVKDSTGTVTYLKMMRNFIDAYQDKKLKPLERIYKMWYSLFICRMWREYVQNSTRLKIDDNFLSRNCYSCIELNAHSLVSIILYLRERNKSHLFRPEFFESQPCEDIFRRIRSFSPTYSTVVQCSVKDIVNRMNKIQLQWDIAFRCTDFNFPRMKTYSQDIENQIIHELPSKEEIICEIRKSRSAAIKFAIQIGLRDTKNANDPVACNINVLHERAENRLDVQEKDDEWETEDEDEQIPILGNIELKDFSYKFEESPDPKSAYVEILCGKYERRKVLKKSSLCWLLREETQRISSDRLQRVRCKRGRRRLITPSKITNAYRNHFNRKKNKT